MASALRRHSLKLFAMLFFLCSLITLPRSESLAENFRIETKIYVGDEDKPVSETTTLFQDGTVYDFLSNPTQTAVFTKPTVGKPRRFILLHPGKRIRTEFDTDQLTGAMDKLRTWAGRQNDTFLKFAADPQFEETFDSVKNELVLASHVENYKVTTSSEEHAEALAEYREFLDWYARLNALLQGSAPPEPRLRLNEALARHEVIPLKIELTRSGEKKSLRAEHDFTWLLSRDDEKRIDDVSNALFGYKQVTNEEFNRAVRPQAVNGK